MIRAALDVSPQRARHILRRLEQYGWIAVKRQRKRGSPLICYVTHRRETAREGVPPILIGLL
jgi:predicted ArsR family transcriptional regulator